MQVLVEDPLKMSSISNCIVQAVRSRGSVIMPTLLGLGVQMDKEFRSKWLVNHLSWLGFAVTYDEVLRYKQSVLQSKSCLTNISKGMFTQWVADNVDHNMATFDGKGSFHGMGIIAISTPKDSCTEELKKKIHPEM